MTKNHKYLIGTGILLLIGIGGFIFWSNQEQALASFQMRGNVVEIKGNSIVFSGGFDVDEQKGAEARNFEVQVSDNTKISKTTLFVPGGVEMFMVDDLEKEEAVADFTALKSDSSNRAVGLELTLKKNIFGKPQMTAAEIKYKIIEYRDSPAVPPLP